jgi:glutathione S-transferase
MTASTQDPPKPNFDHQTALRVLGLGLLVHMLRSPRLWERVAIAAVVVAAMGGLAGLDKESRAKALARVIAWLKQQDEHIENVVKDAVT